MSDQSLLCKCTFCLDENVNGVLLNRNIYNRHYLRIQEYSVRDENLENMDLQTEENMNLHAKENMSLYAEEDMNLQEDNLNLVNENSDTESFNLMKKITNIILIIIMMMMTMTMMMMMMMMIIMMIMR